MLTSRSRAIQASYKLLGDRLWIAHCRDVPVTGGVIISHGGLLRQ